MGTRRVLGNDPFQRGAAERPPVVPRPAPEDPALPEAASTRSSPEETERDRRKRSAALATEAPTSEGRTRPKPSRSASKGAARGASPASRSSKVPASSSHPPPAPPSRTGPAPRPTETRMRRDTETATGVAPGASSGRALDPAAPVPSSPGPGVSTPPQSSPPQPAARGASPAPESLTSGIAVPPIARPDPRTSRSTDEGVRAPPAPPAAARAPASTAAPDSAPAPTLSWTPLPATTPPPTVEPELPSEPVATPGGGGTLVEALREAPGLLAEAWSAIEAALRALRAGLGTGGGEQLDVYGRDERLSEAVAPLVDFLYHRWFRVEVEGAAHVPPGGALLVANHAGALPLDGPMLHEALRRERPDLPEARWLAEDQVFYAPLLGTLFNRLGAVRASPDSAVRLLGEGRPVLVFPEGIQGIGKPFRERYRLQRFGRGGFVKLALRTRRPILPVAIMGAEETLPLLGKLPGGALGVPYVPVTPFPLPAKWRIRIGEPLQVPPGATETDLSVVESLVEATRSTIEHMLRGMLGARGGVFLG